MKRLEFSLTVLFCISFFCCCCNKEDLDDPKIIPLKHVDLMPVTNGISIDNDTIMDIVIYSDSALVYQGEPQDIYVPVNGIKSVNENVLISYGGLLQSGHVYLLDKDSMVDNSLEWVSKFVIYSPGPYISEKFNPNYIGIKHTKNNQTFFGWIHKQGSFTEFAIDTSIINTGNVYAGNKYK